MFNDKEKVKKNYDMKLLKLNNINHSYYRCCTNTIESKSRKKRYAYE